MASPAEKISVSGAGVDLSSRFFESHAVAASPATNAITTICTLTITSNVAITYGIQLYGWAAFTVGTSGAAATLQIRETNTTGTQIATTGATTGGIAATNLVDMNVQGVDLAPALALPGAVYVLCLTIASGAATSTVSACQLTALIV